MNGNEKIVLDSLSDLVVTIKTTIEAERINGNIQPQEEIYKHFIVDEFHYDGEFPSIEAHCEDISTNTWFKAQNKIHELIKKTKIYYTVEDCLNSITNRKSNSNTLDELVFRLIHTYFSEKEKFDRKAEELSLNYIRELKGMPIKYFGTVYLQGVVLELDQIQINDNVLLRRAKKEDFEYNAPAEYFVPRSFDYHFSSAFLEIEIYGIGPVNLQNEISKLIVLLRLFKIGGITVIKYRIDSESFFSISGGTISSMYSDISFGKYTINEEHVIPLKHFWNLIYTLIPTHLYEQNKVDHISIAYQHYTDSQTRKGILEQRIATAIMGLEAVLLKSDEKSELSYRLGIRTAKIFSIFSKNSIDIREAVKDAYHVRSVFLHGDKLPDSKKKKLTSKYGDLTNLFEKILDCLRDLLIMSFMVDIDKEKFIDLIDDSFIDEEKNKQLVEIIRNHILKSYQ
ncbi:HEPN domain-containing protein [Methanosarcina mazei]|uniref:Uncharacterized protein n=1 Tax=Methanosarcina mazei TaxID=2209 RepID=A0A0F8MT58_METMZ|nr:HEPN domain-containing protein [Methanosarcina mazei]KKG75489.1 hypothetical protein DU63_11485 [Methanosarcina mazei]KKH15384.1 hypothetical protein DU48_04610 [Methanosarcina mazei]KKH17532.1 hypothetical protein DU44_03790 [Methanosarcina mazei]KKH24080.1 hypothetical protein DU65_07015 [Methanosarcina mazei]